MRHARSSNVSTGPSIHQTALGTLALLVLLALLGAGFLGCGAQHGSATPGLHGNWKSLLAARAERSAGADLSPRSFSGLSEPMALPAEERRRAYSVLGPGTDALGLDFEHAYFLKTRWSVGLWLLKGHGIACVFNSRSFAAACDTVPHIAKRGLVIVSGRAPVGDSRPEVTALGIVPNGFRSVRVGLVGARDKLVLVSNNSFVVRARRPIVVKGLRR